MTRDLKPLDGPTGEQRAALARLRRAALLFAGPGSTEQELRDAAVSYARLWTPDAWKRGLYPVDGGIE